jgi:flavodoxin
MQYFLVVFYSRTGTTRKVAQDIAGLLGCDSEEIIDLKDRSGIIKGYLSAAKEALDKKMAPIQGIRNDPASYDMVIIGTPVWAFTMACAIRTYITANKDKFKRLAFFCTVGGLGAKKTLADMEAICGKVAQAALG